MKTPDVGYPLRHSAYRLDAGVRYFTDLLAWLDDPARGGASTQPLIFDGYSAACLLGRLNQESRQLRSHL
jgi:hypothetical protein